MTYTPPTDLRSKRLADLTLDDVVETHLSNLPRIFTADYILISSLDQLSEEMFVVRASLGAADMRPLLTAFAILDQLGSTYADAARPTVPDNTPSIRKALHHWAGVDESDPRGRAIYAMRNGLVHDGALTDEARSGAWRIFRYGSVPGDFIKLPVAEWDGSSTALGPDTTHTVDVDAFTSLVSVMIREVRDCFEQRRSDLQILQSREDLIHKYLFWEQYPPAS